MIYSQDAAEKLRGAYYGSGLTSALIHYIPTDEGLVICFDIYYQDGIRLLEDLISRQCKIFSHEPEKVAIALWTESLDKLYAFVGSLPLGFKEYKLH